MAISIRENQALGFGSDRSCNCGGVYCQPIQTNDTYMIQGTVSAATNSNKVLNGDFSSSTGWNLQGAWSISGGKLIGVGINSGEKAETNTTVYELELLPNIIYRVDINLTVTDQGTTGTDDGWYIVINGEYLPLPNTTLGAGYNQSLSATWYYKSAVITNDSLYISVNDSSIELEVEYINVYEMSSVGVQVIDGAGNVIEDYPDAAFVDYYPEDSYTGITNSVLFEATLDFSTLVEAGCYNISFYDSLLTEVNRVKNGDFPIGLAWWTVGDNWSWDGSEKAHYTPDFITAGQLYQTITVVGGVQYYLTFFITSLGVGNQMRVFVDTGSGSTLLGTFTGNGPKEAFIDLTGQTGQVNITIYFAGGQTEHEFMLDAVSLVAFEADSSNVSQCVSIKENHDCTVLLTAYNNDDAFGFVFSQGYEPNLRVKAKFDVIAYPEEKEEYLFSDNSRSLLFARSEKEYDVKVSDAPEYIHDCIRLMRLNDNFFIDGEQYISSSDYDLRGRKTSKLKQSVFNVKDRVGISSNYSC